METPFLMSRVKGKGTWKTERSERKVCQGMASLNCNSHIHGSMYSNPELHKSMYCLSDVSVFVGEGVWLSLWRFNFRSERTSATHLVVLSFCLSARSGATRMCCDEDNKKEWRQCSGSYEEDASKAVVSEKSTHCLIRNTKQVNFFFNLQVYLSVFLSLSVVSVEWWTLSY